MTGLTEPLSQKDFDIVLHETLLPMLDQCAKQVDLKKCATKKDLKKFATKKDLEKLEISLRGEMKTLKVSLYDEMHEMKNEIKNEVREMIQELRTEIRGYHTYIENRFQRHEHMEHGAMVLSDKAR